MIENEPEIFKKKSIEEEKLDSLTEGLTRLKNKMKYEEKISEHSSEEPIMVRVTSKKKRKKNKVNVSGTTGKFKKKINKRCISRS